MFALSIGLDIIRRVQCKKKRGKKEWDCSYYRESETQRILGAAQRVSKEKARLSRALCDEITDFIANLTRNEQTHVKIKRVSIARGLFLPGSLI